MNIRLLRPASLNGFALVCTLIACALFVWPVSSEVSMRDGDAPDTQARRAVADPPRGVRGSVVDSLAIVVVDGNVFSATRQAPRTRFILPGQAAALAVTMNGAMDSTSAMSVGALSDSFPRVTGIVTTNGERRALVQFVLSDGAPSLYRVGDAHAGYRVLRIESDNVVLAIRGGRRTLRLPSRTAPDSLGKQP